MQSMELIGFMSVKKWPKCVLTLGLKLLSKVASDPPIFEARNLGERERERTNFKGLRLTRRPQTRTHARTSFFRTV